MHFAKYSVMIMTLLCMTITSLFHDDAIAIFLRGQRILVENQK